MVDKLTKVTVSLKRHSSESILKCLILILRSSLLYPAALLHLFFFPLKYASTLKTRVNETGQLDNTTLFFFRSIRMVCV